MFLKTRGADLSSALLLQESLLLLSLQLLELIQALLLLHALLLQALFLLLLILLQPSPPVGESEERSRRGCAEGKGGRTHRDRDGGKEENESKTGGADREDAWARRDANGKGLNARILAECCRKIQAPPARAAGEAAQGAAAAAPRGSAAALVPPSGASTRG
jgi:hypothetical protein